VGKFGHIVGFVELCRIDLIDLVRIDFSLLRAGKQFAP
jgi:hypothetical protein